MWYPIDYHDIIIQKNLNIHLIFVSLFDFKHPYSYPISDMGIWIHILYPKRYLGIFFLFGKRHLGICAPLPPLDGGWLGKMSLSCSTPSHKAHELKLEAPHVKNSMEYFQYILSILNYKLFYYHKSNFFNLIKFMDRHGNIKIIKSNVLLMYI